MLFLSDLHRFGRRHDARLVAGVSSDNDGGHVVSVITAWREAPRSPVNRVEDLIGRFFSVRPEDVQRAFDAKLANRAG